MPSSTAQSDDLHTPTADEPSILTDSQQQQQQQTEPPEDQTVESEQENVMKIHTLRFVFLFCQVGIYLSGCVLTVCLSLQIHDSRSNG